MNNPTVGAPAYLPWARRRGCGRILKVRLKEKTEGMWTPRLMDEERNAAHAGEGNVGFQTNTPLGVQGGEFIRRGATGPSAEIGRWR